LINRVDNLNYPKAVNDLKRHISLISPSIKQAISRVIDSGWLVLGQEVKAFEEEFASYCHSSYCVSVANGTDALELALRALGIERGKTVLTVANAGMYSTIAIQLTGARPVFADIMAESLLIDVDDLKRILRQQKIDAIVITHLYGLLGSINEIVGLAHDYGIPVIEDCAQAHGAILNGQKAGSFGDVGCFSFYPTKNLGALGDGGAIVSNRSDLADRIFKLRQYGWSSKYRTELIGGRNSRLDEIQAAVLRIMLPMLDQWNSRRREIARRYTSRICNPKVITQKIYGEEYVAHLYVVRAVQRNSLVKHLVNAGVPYDIHYPLPDYLQASCRHMFSGVDLPVTLKACEEVLTLPCFPEMSNEEVDYVCDCINSW